MLEMNYTHIFLNKNVLLKKNKNSFYAFNTEKGDYFILNSSTFLILSLLEHYNHVVEIVETIISFYNMQNEREIKKDFFTCIEKCKKFNLITSTENTKCIMC